MPFCPVAISTLSMHGHCDQHSLLLYTIAGTGMGSRAQLNLLPSSRMPSCPVLDLKAHTHTQTHAPTHAPTHQRTHAHTTHRLMHQHLHQRTNAPTHQRINATTQKRNNARSCHTLMHRLPHTLGGTGVGSGTQCIMLPSLRLPACLHI